MSKTFFFFQILTFPVQIFQDMICDIRCGVVTLWASSRRPQNQLCGFMQYIVQSNTKIKVWTSSKIIRQSWIPLTMPILQLTTEWSWGDIEPFNLMMSQPTWNLVRNDKQTRPSKLSLIYLNYPPDTPDTRQTTPRHPSRHPRRAMMTIHLLLIVASSIQPAWDWCNSGDFNGTVFTMV